MSWKDVEEYPIEGPVDEQYVRDFIEWEKVTPVMANAVEHCARLKAIEDAGFKEYYRELNRPRVEALQRGRSERQRAWLVSEEYQWLRSYLLSATNGRVEEVEELIRSDCSSILRHPTHSRERMANWLWNTRHYFEVMGDLGTVLELGAIAREVEAEEGSR